MGKYGGVRTWCVCVSVVEGVVQQEQISLPARRVSHTSIGGPKGKRINGCHSHQCTNVRVCACPRQTRAAD